MHTHRGLDHITPLSSHLKYEFLDIDIFVRGHSLDEDVQCYECTSTTYTSTGEEGEGEGEE